MKFPSSPRILKGAFIQFDEQTPQGRVIVFQYNPEKILRKLETDGEQNHDKKEKNFIKAIKSPRETITLTLTLDATDDLEFADAHSEAVQSGVFPQLSAIEGLVYRQDSEHTHISFLGISWPISTNKKSLTLFVWGSKRVLPVLVTELSIKEEMFDPNLNPTRADIEVKMVVLNDSELAKPYKMFRYWESHLATKIAMAKSAYTKSEIGDLTKL